VLICDSFSQNNPSNVETYNCLSLVDEFPAVWYTLSWLTDNQVEEVFVLYSKDKAEIENFFSTYEKSIDLKCHLNYVKPGELKSFGDAIREIQFRNLVSDDFLVLYANTITNMDLSKMIHSHFLKKD
jgi:translation initiation factor eIF-2B subunit epsilon